MTHPRRTYSQEAIQQILHLAITQQEDHGELSREQLQEIATEIGISPELLEQAEQQWMAAQAEQGQLGEYRHLQRAKLKRRLGRFGIINAALLGLNGLMGFDTPWSLYILCFWGLIFGLKTWNVLYPDQNEHERQFKRWQRQHQVRQAVDRWLSRWLDA